MTRVSENSSTAAIQYAMNKAKSKLEDLQLKGTTLKDITKPSDDPAGNVDLLTLRSQNVDAKQYGRNSQYAKTMLEYTESALTDLAEIAAKAKEIAIAQASDIYSPDIRRAVSKEISQLKKQTLGISNRRLGQRYIFAGHSTLTQPFNKLGEYKGDQGKIFIEVNRDYFVPVNMTGSEVFYGEGPELSDTHNNPLDKFPKFEEANPNTPLAKDQPNEFEDPNLNTRDPNQDFRVNREPASKPQFAGKYKESFFDTLTILENALETNNAEVIQDLLPVIDDAHNRFVRLRTRIGAISNSVAAADTSREQSILTNESQKSMVEDADIAELFSGITKQQAILDATYRAGSKLVNRTLLDFLQ